MNSGRTYTLTDDNGSSLAYFKAVSELVDELLEIIPDHDDLLKVIRKGSSPLRFFEKLNVQGKQRSRFLQKMESSLSPFLGPIEEHLSSLPLSDRLDPVLRTARIGYLSYMVEIELVNRINIGAFKKAHWRMALVAHCLRDFRPDCQAVSGEVEEVCVLCDEECLIGSGTRVLEEHGVETFISVSMDHKELFSGLQGKHPDMGVLGIACVRNS